MCVCVCVVCLCVFVCVHTCAWLHVLWMAYSVFMEVRGPVLLLVTVHPLKEAFFLVTNYICQVSAHSPLDFSLKVGALG